MAKITVFFPRANKFVPNILGFFTKITILVFNIPGLVPNLSVFVLSMSVIVPQLNVFVSNKTFLSSLKQYFYQLTKKYIFCPKSDKVGPKYTVFSPKLLY